MLCSQLHIRILQPIYLELLYLERVQVRSTFLLGEAKGCAKEPWRSGGYLAIQLALSHPDGIRAVVPAYPLLDIKAPFYTEAYPKRMWDLPMYPTSDIDDHLKTIKPGYMISSPPPPYRGQLAITIAQQGRLAEFLGSEPILYPEERVAAGATLPPTFIYHGTADSMVPFEGTEKFVKLLKQKNTVKGRLHFQITDGEHSFDHADSLNDANSWISSGLALIQEALR